MSPIRSPRHLCETVSNKLNKAFGKIKKWKIIKFKYVTDRNGFFFYKIISEKATTVV